MPKFLSSVCEVQEAVAALRQSPQSEAFARAENAEVIGSILRNRRESIGASVEQVAELVGLQPGTVSEIEKGNGYCAFDWVLLVANVLGIDLFVGARKLNHENF